MLDCERATLCQHEKTNELYTEVGEGLDEKSVINFPITWALLGLFYLWKPVNIPHAYADLRFNPSFDKANWILSIYLVHAGLQ